jgi:acetamidase/formamidase
MALDLAAGFPTAAAHRRHHLPATPQTCYWGYIDRDQPPVLEVNDGDVIEVEAVTHHAGDAPDLMMDDGIRALWAGIPEGERSPGVHILTGPIHIRGAEPGDLIAVKILSMTPRLRHGSNVAANWGLLYDTFGKERVTIYSLDDSDESAPADQAHEAHGFPTTASPMFGFDFTTRPIYDIPGVISLPNPEERALFSRSVNFPVRPHFGVMGVAPAESGRRSSIPPGVFGGNVDNWRIGPGVTMTYPVFVPGAHLYVGDPHFAQGDGEICGTAIEASLNAVIQVKVVRGVGATAPLLQTGGHWFTHGFGDDLDSAMRMAAEQMLWLMQTHLHLSADEAYSLASVAVDLGVTQVVDGTLGCHAALARDLVS